MRASFDGISSAGDPAHTQQVEQTSSNQRRWYCLLVRLGSERLLKWGWRVGWEKEATFNLKYAVPIN